MAKSRAWVLLYCIILHTIQSETRRFLNTDQESQTVPYNDPSQSFHDLPLPILIHPCTLRLQKTSLQHAFDRTVKHAIATFGRPFARLITRVQSLSESLFWTLWLERPPGHPQYFDHRSRQRVALQSDDTDRTKGRQR
jgi:hypothetical protein